MALKATGSKNSRPIDFTLQSLLKASGKRMRADLAERLVSHPGELGIGREEVIRQFLRAYWEYLEKAKSWSAEGALLVLRRPTSFLEFSDPVLI